MTKIVTFEELGFGKARLQAGLPIDHSVIGHMTAANHCYIAVDRDAKGGRALPFATYEIMPSGEGVEGNGFKTRPEALRDLSDRAMKWFMSGRR